jgi:hypothetical protein
VLLAARPVMRISLPLISMRSSHVSAGLAANATELVGQLGRQPGLVDVRATGANVRDAALNKERFTFEMRWRAEGAKP